MSNCYFRSLAVLTSVVAFRTVAAQRPADSAIVTQAASMAHAPDRARARGGAVAYSIDSTEIMSSSGHTLSEVIQARVPSLSVLAPGGAAAQGSPIRSRG